ncbi:phosphoribosylglycinamide formyltransferase [Jeotgalibacillus proteolyticus]|uniref:Phosphoribosylglycinamide formyltransferase n=1 Tax=Jeotgalibacillus proteolyticus TaxID=2082395 RepID=A0A2S5G7Q4_9BACL|nr:phosphoribosylglycinamide formyltransferase [Jeotgalibacillus proteolyticus]PPA68985.1 phosphoribosylglycinamide formyltransferase [Jeotgalibacillus proteolyticus]
MTKIALFASGNGSNVQAIIDAIEQKKLNAAVELVVCDKPNAFVIERAKNAGIDVFSFQAKSFSSKEEYEKIICEKLEEKGIEWIILAGYMRLIGKVLLSAYEKKIINIHPSLLPAFPGKDAVGQAVEYGVKVMGVTIHYVDEGMDTGPIIAQESFAVSEEMDKVQIEKQIHSIEHKLYPSTLQQLFT